MAIPESYQSYIFMGESGSGKTELSVNFSIHLAKRTKKNIYFFDMDQTKGLFRARDLQPVLMSNSVLFCETTDFMDAPVVPAGVTGALSKRDTICVFDVGGNAIGARMIGQFTKEFCTKSACAIYAINPYRPFSSNWEDIELSMKNILSASQISIEQVKIFSNPCIGEKTSAKNILKTHKWLTGCLEKNGLEVSALAAEYRISEQIQQDVFCPVFPIRLYIRELYKN